MLFLLLVLKMTINKNLLFLNARKQPFWRKSNCSARFVGRAVAFAIFQ